LAKEKHYLTQVVIKSLQSYEGPTSDLSAVVRDYQEVITLLKRKLYDHALDRTNKALADAWALELFEVVIQLLYAKHSSLFNMQRFTKLPPLTAELKKASALTIEEFEMVQLRGEAMYYDRSRNKPKEFKALMQHPLLKGKVEKLKSLRAQIIWFNIRHLNLFSNASQPAELREVAIAEVNHYKKHPQIKIINPVAYYGSFIRVAEAESATGNHVAALQSFEKVKSILKPTSQLPKLRVESFTAYLNIAIVTELRYLKRYKEALAMLEKTAPIIRQRPSMEIHQHFFDYALVLFHLQRSKEAIDKIEELLQIKEDVANDIQRYIRPLLILAQLDIGNAQLIPYLIKSAKAWMKRGKSTLEGADLFFSLTYAIAKAPETQRRQRWLKLKEATDQGRLENFNREFLLKEWVDRKLTRPGF
jgi:tetratricopeptide (TPR) repeat protein